MQPFSKSPFPSLYVKDKNKVEYIVRLDVMNERFQSFRTRCLHAVGGEGVLIKLSHVVFVLLISPRNKHAGEKRRRGRSRRRVAGEGN